MRFKSFVLIFCYPSLAQTQEVRSRTEATSVVDAIPFGPLTPASRFLFGRPGTLFDAHASVPVFLWSRTSALTAGKPQACLISSTRKSRYVTGCTIVFTPRFAIRQLSSDAAPSAPVRTPSFNPVLEYNTYAWEPDISRRTLHHLAFRAAHYSNGQEGCFFVESLAPTCDRPELPAAVRPAINTTAGSFSTHYFEIEYNQAEVKFTKATAGSSAPDIERWLWYWGAAWRVSPAFLADIGGMNNDLADAYGRHQFSARLGWRLRSASTLGLTYALEADAQYAEGRKDVLNPPVAGPLRIAIESRITSSHLYGLGFVARYDAGWDQYNVNFTRKIRGLRGTGLTLGIAIEHARAIAISEGAAQLILDRLR